MSTVGELARTVLLGPYNFKTRIRLPTKLIVPIYFIGGRWHLSLYEILQIKIYKTRQINLNTLWQCFNVKLISLSYLSIIYSLRFSSNFVLQIKRKNSTCSFMIKKYIEKNEWRLELNYAWINQWNWIIFFSAKITMLLYNETYQYAIHSILNSIYKCNMHEFLRDRTMIHIDTLKSSTTLSRICVHAHCTNK